MLKTMHILIPCKSMIRVIGLSSNKLYVGICHIIVNNVMKAAYITTKFRNICYNAMERINNCS